MMEKIKFIIMKSVLVPYGWQLIISNAWQVPPPHKVSFVPITETSSSVSTSNSTIFEIETSLYSFKVANSLVLLILIVGESLLLTEDYGTVIIKN